jgi:hypothetical protein
MTMSSKLSVVVAVALMLGSASTVLAANNGRANHRHQRIERLMPPTLFEGRDVAPQGNSGCSVDDGGGRFRPCSALGGGA